jgi:hypothetical protein
MVEVKPRLWTKAPGFRNRRSAFGRRSISGRRASYSVSQRFGSKRLDARRTRRVHRRVGQLFQVSREIRNQNITIRSPGRPDRLGLRHRLGKPPVNCQRRWQRSQKHWQGARRALARQAPDRLRIEATHVDQQPTVLTREDGRKKDEKSERAPHQARDFNRLRGSE